MIEFNDKLSNEAQPTCGNPLLPAVASTELDTKDKKIEKTFAGGKLILDACCGGRMFWWNKQNEHTLFMDCREVDKGAFNNNWNPNWCVKPDVIADFRKMPFADKSFKMVIYDPPHLTSGSMKSVINKKYGLLNKETWKEDIVAWFKECWRVLDDYGVHYLEILQAKQERQFGLLSLNIERWQEKFFQFFRSYQRQPCYEARLLLVTLKHWQYCRF